MIPYIKKIPYYIPFYGDYLRYSDEHKRICANQAKLASIVSHWKSRLEFLEKRKRGFKGRVKPKGGDREIREINKEIESLRENIDSLKTSSERQCQVQTWKSRVKNSFGFASFLVSFIATPIIGSLTPSVASAVIDPVQRHLLCNEEIEKKAEKSVTRQVAFNTEKAVSKYFLLSYLRGFILPS